MSKKGNVIFIVRFLYLSINLSIKHFVKPLEVVYHLVRSTNDKKALGSQDLFVTTLEVMYHIVRSEWSGSSWLSRSLVKTLEVVYHLVHVHSE